MNQTAIKNRERKEDLRTTMPGIPHLPGQDAIHSGVSKDQLHPGRDGLEVRSVVPCLGKMKVYPNEITQSILLVLDD